MNRIDAMQIFTRVAELSSFTLAADLMRLPKATVSTAIQQLERELGTRLLHRTTRRVQITQDGQLFYERCKDLLADLEELQNLFCHDSTALTGRLRVDMPSAVASEVVLPQLPDFLQAHPALEIELSSSERRVDLIREGFDCVMRVGALGDISHIARPLGYYRMVNCVSPAYLARHGQPDHPDQLATHRLIHYAPTLGTRDQGFEYMDPDHAGVVRYHRMKGALTVNSSAAYYGACLAGLGIIQVPEAGVIPALAREELFEFMPRYRAAAMPVSLIYANRRHQPRRVRVFMNWLAALMQERLIPAPDRAG
ncbi:LysR family transcriptional regulator [Denitromonas halophila]|uniref:LysR family transcriptional regulator n=1 Tax=Denitromonas halophila TaxID=1629404 RepID=A0A557QPD3_9RHOO|nr:LysR family transcriptional regulator [Denitromonas halophila]TVO54772.1 LysR family transcriptional regulator [Denitromonas halophila]